MESTRLNKYTNQHCPSWLDVPISFFTYDHQRGRFANVPSQQTTLRRIVTTSHYRPLIEQIRAEPDATQQGELKKQLPAISPVSWLHHRRRDTSFAQKIRQQWPLLMGDIDCKENPGVDMTELKRHLARLPYVMLCAYSVRGGLWFVVRLPDHQTPDTLAAHFRYLQRLFSEKFGIKLDRGKGGNPTDLRFVSYDAAPYLNDSPTVMGKTYTPPKLPPAAFDFSRFQGRSDAELLTRLISRVEAAGEGNRHITLRSHARLAGGYIAAGRIDEATTVCALETVASEWPDFRKSQGTIRDGIRDGRAAPVFAEEEVYSSRPVRKSTDQRPAPLVDQPRVVNTLSEWEPGSILRPDPTMIEFL